MGKGAIAAAEHHSKFDAQQRASWKPGEAVPFPFLVETFIAIEATSKRLEIVNILTNALRTIIATTPEDLLPTVYLFANRVAPAHQGVELGIGDAILIKVQSGVINIIVASIRPTAVGITKSAPSSLTIIKLLRVTCLHARFLNGRVARSCWPPSQMIATSTGQLPSS